jgi:hypothetical protein
MSLDLQACVEKACKTWPLSDEFVYLRTSVGQFLQKSNSSKFLEALETATASLEQSLGEVKAPNFVMNDDKVSAFKAAVQNAKDQRLHPVPPCIITCLGSVLKKLNLKTSWAAASKKEGLFDVLQELCRVMAHDKHTYWTKCTTLMLRGH